VSDKTKDAVITITLHDVPDVFDVDSTVEFFKNAVKNLPNNETGRQNSGVVVDGKVS
jgi:hypothetical protein